MSVKNRFDGILREQNKALVDLGPANVTSRIILSIELQRALKDIQNPRILELAAGEGFLTEYLLEYNPNITIDAVDLSSEMIETSKQRLQQFSDQIHYFHQDAIKFTKNQQANTYDAVVTGWFVHNLHWDKKNELIMPIYNVLKPKRNFFLFDKVYPDNNYEAQKMLEVQLNRYKYLPKHVEEAIVDHEQQDFHPNYKMTVQQTTNWLAKEFKDFRLVDRVERDIVVIAHKHNF